MTEDVAAIEVPFHARLRAGMRQGHNWTQLLRFLAVGASGYVVNLIVYEGFHSGLGVNYLVAAVPAFVVALANNFFWNRHWTFAATDKASAGFQAPRFVVVSLAAFVVNLVALKVLVHFGSVGELPAQAIAILLATPVNFLGNKLWSFAR